MTESLLVKYRPHSFDEVVGHDAVVASLQNAVRKNSSHAFLFTGTSGVGKTTLARLVAEALGCARQAIANYDAATFTGVDDMRELAANVSVRPIMSKIHAVVIDEVQGLSKQAWNSLLMITEEPPPWAYWFFCTTEANKVPKTMRTRCLSYDLKPVGRSALLKLADRVIAGEGFRLAPEAARLCVERADGSPRQLIANLGLVSAAQSKAEVLELLELAEENAAAVDLARALIAGTTWANVRDNILPGLAETNPESVRHVVRAYATKVALNPKTSPVAPVLYLLECFSEPFNSADGVTPLVRALGRYLLSNS